MDVKHKNILYKLLSLPEELIKRSLFKKADKIVCASIDYIENSDIKNLYRKNKDKFREIPFYVDTEKIFPREDLKKKDYKELMFAGGLDKAHYFKGVDVLIRSFSKVKTNKKIKLTITGDGELKEEYIKLSKSLKIEERVNFVGRLSFNELIKLYQRSDLLILPSINNNEAFGIVLIEAMACKTPVIASNLPGVRKVFKNNFSGLLIEPRNEEDLSNKIEEMINNESKTSEMGEKAYQLVIDKYDKKIIKTKTISLIKETI